MNYLFKISIAIVILFVFLLFASMPLKKHECPQTEEFQVTLYCIVNERITIAYEIPVKNDTLFDITGYIPDSYKVYLICKKQ
jgi:hypothetical protein